MSNSNSDWLDPLLGKFCKGVQENIDTLPLTWNMKNRAKEWLDDCASKAQDSDSDTRSAFNNAYHEFHSRFKAKTEMELKDRRWS